MQHVYAHAISTSAASQEPDGLPFVVEHTLLHKYVVQYHFETQEEADAFHAMLAKVGTMYIHVIGGKV